MWELGLNYCDLNEIDSANLKMKLASDLASKINLNLGKNFMNDYQLMFLYMLEKDIAQRTYYNDYDYVIKFGKIYIDIYEKFNNEIFNIYSNEYTRYLLLISNAYLMLGDINSSLNYSNKALGNIDNIQNEFGFITKDWQLTTSLILGQISRIYSQIGDYKKAINYNIQALDFIKLYENGIFNLNSAIAYNNLSKLYINIGDETKSFISNETSLFILDSIFIDKEDSINYIAPLETKAELQYQFGYSEKSFESINKCIKLIKDFYGINNFRYLSSLHNLSFLLKQEKKIDKAIELEIEVLNNISKNSDVYLNSLYQLAKLKILKNDYLEADSLIIEFVKSSETFFNRNNLGLSEKDKESYFKRFNSAKMFLANYLLNKNQENSTLNKILLEMIFNSKSSLLNTNMIISKRVNLTKDSSLIDLYDKWKISKLKLAKYYEKSSKDLEQLKINLNKEEFKSNQLEQQLSNKISNISDYKKKYKLEEIASVLKNDEAYIEIFRTNFNSLSESKWNKDSVRYIALLIDKKTVKYPKLIVLKNGDNLEQTGYKYYSSYTSGRNKGKWDEYSYLNYWSAIAEKLEGKKRVYVSSDGVYNKINLNVLYNKETGNYLGEEMDIRLVTSGKDLFKTYPKKEKNKELTAVLVGSPKYDLVQNQVEEQELLVSRDLQQYWIDSLSRGWSVSSLPGTAKEVSNISKLMNNKNWEVTTYTEASALEARVKSVRSPTVLHLATHGYFFEDVAKEKESTTRMMGVDTKKATQNPLLRSGLLFAGAKNTLNGNEPKSGDNGLLTAYEASYMNLRGTELVVLSACETGRGEIKNGEGVYGLQRAMQQAGAENIIMSMWKVDDKVTQEFMTTFYEKWLGGVSMRNAFNQTQKQIKEKYEHPYYWGAFVMIGR